MRIEERVVGGVMIFDLHGEMTARTADACSGFLKDRLNRFVQQGHRKLVLNLEAVAYMDSMCLGDIISAYTTLSRHAGKLKLLKVPRRILELLAIAGLVNVFDIFGSEQEAVESFPINAPV